MTSTTAIYDLQNVAVTQNFESEASVKTGRTGGLPYVGVGWYRTRFDAPTEGRTVLLFDGAMSEARLFVNGREACFWPFGYNSFWCDVTDYLNRLYRNVHLITTSAVHVPVWGTQITTPHVAEEYASVRFLTQIQGTEGKSVRISSTCPRCPFSADS